METKKRARDLCVFLIKDKIRGVEEIVDIDQCQTPISVPVSGAAHGTLFVKKTPPTPPKWAALFKSHVNPSSLSVNGVSAAFVLKVGNRFFVLTFGHGRFLLREGVSEERFGLLCALNAVDPSSYRCIDVQSLDAIQSHSRIQSGQEATPEEFGLDVEQDMLKAIVGKPIDESLGRRMTGTDSLSVSVRMDLSDLPALLQKYRDKFEIDLTETNHEWVNNISIVRNTELIATLETMLVEKLNSDAVSDVWLAIPEIIDWTHVAGFEFDRGKGETRTDITLEGFIGTLNGGPIDLATLKSRRVHCVDADHNRTFRSWSAFRCLYAEIDLAKRKYILNDSKWFSVADDFVARTDKHFAGIPASKLKLPAYAGGGEGKYNSGVATAEPGTYALLDQNLVTHGGSRGKIEVCDLLHVERHLIHVKLYGKSSVLSHLISQGFVSGQLIQIDGEFRKKVIAKLSPPFSELLHEANRPKPNEFTVVYAVISSGPGKLHLPFFSRVNLNNTAKLLVGLGYNVELLKIDVDEAFAKTVKAAPHKRRKTKKAA